MKRFYDKELIAFRAQLNLMGELALNQFSSAISAFIKSDANLAKRAIEMDDEIDLLELRIDDEALRYMNLRNPIATDLRLVIAGMKASHDLERIGDECTNIARQTIELDSEINSSIQRRIAHMADLARSMVKDAVECLVEVDVGKAREIISRDREVDSIKKEVSMLLRSAAEEKKLSVNNAVAQILIAKSVERVADHATNIAEEAVFLVEAQNIRHTQDGTSENKAENQNPTQ